MEALLGSIQSKPSCASIDDLQAQFRQAFELEVSPTKARHISASYDIRAGVTFTVVVSGPEHAALESAATLHPSLRGLPKDTDVGTGQPLGGGKYTHQISSGDVILNQPQDDPILQRTVARHVAEAFSEVDGSTWIVKSVAKTAPGWSFVYSCKDSPQAWLRAHAKTSRPTVGEFSGKDNLDAVNLCK